ncbi:MAG: NAD-dependent epimerase/dehydratase family protein [Deltaproteobacteria bacterium]|nr:NAD-dependent epimerase/dehydratase family protein [Deltaproteobacteria bacterium]TLN00304.1 MAG: NAD-dependent epimerase/dehydratase family protein [bacterium]
METRQRTILVAGATGFIGKRLVTALLAEGFRVRVVVRSHGRQFPHEVETIPGDLLDRSSLDSVLDGIDTAFYLVHSMAAGRAGFERRDRQAAENFVSAANRTGLRRAIYLGGLGETGSGLSKHLASRLEVAEILKSGNFMTTVLRAAIIIGSGGASYEIIKALVERLPVMITPKWVSTSCQPIAVRDVIKYLTGCLLDERTAGDTFDIGGPEILTYREMMQRFARIRNRKILIIPVPFLTPRLSSYWVGLVTPAKPSVAIPLIEGLRNEVICRDKRIREILPIPLTSFDESIRIAMAEGNRSAGAV